MSTVGIYDADFFAYNHVIPNLECAKLYAYYINRRDIPRLTPTFDPEPYTHYWIRKDYNDGNYPAEYFKYNFGGRVFFPNEYKALSEEIEHSIPNIEIYEKYGEYFKQFKNDKYMFSTLMHAGHIRLQTDGKIMPDKEIKANLTRRPRTIIFHDYNLAAVPGVYDILEEIQNSKTLLSNPDQVFPYRLGVKYPFKISNDQELENLRRLNLSPTFFPVEFKYLPESDIVKELGASEVIYDLNSIYINQDRFLQEQLPQIYLDTLEYRHAKIKLYLQYDISVITCRELQIIIDLINIFARITTQTVQGLNSLAGFCKRQKKLELLPVAYWVSSKHLNFDEVRQAFQFIGKENYELFKYFYEKE